MVVDAILGRGDDWLVFLAAVSEANEELVAPELLWSEATSVLHELAWRGRLMPEDAALGHAAVGSLPIARRQRRNLRARAWEIADRLGWAKTYDAEYCALAELLDCPLVTADRRLRASAGRVLDVLTPRGAALRLTAGSGS